MKLRTALEEAVIRSHGEVSELHSGVIQEAMEWSMYAGLMRKWLREEVTTLSPTDRRAYAYAIADGARQRNAAMRRLGIDARDDAVIARLYGPTDNAD